MSVGRITLTSISKLDGWLWDQQCVGFGVRKQTNKGTFYYVRYRHGSKQIVRSIGRHGHLTPDTARARARQLLGTVAGGTDPFAQAMSSEGFATTIDRYLERKRASLKPITFAEVERYLRNHCQPLHRLRLDQIDRRKVAALLGEVETARGPTSRNRARSVLSAFFAWCVSEGLLDANPVMGTAKANENGSRERVLTAEELKKLWAGLGTDRFGDVVRLLLLTGQRRNEIGLLAWSEVRGREIALPAERCKNGREHTIPLSEQALRILDRIPRRNSSAFVFGDKGFQDWHRCKQLLDERIGFSDWTLHDLRRTCSTNLGELGVLPHVIEQTLNHVSGHKGGVAGVYNKSKMTDAVREGLQKWAHHLDQITA